jgi:CheY-like chemotaxis protein
MAEPHPSGRRSAAGEDRVSGGVLLATRGVEYPRKWNWFPARNWRRLRDAGIPDRRIGEPDRRGEPEGVGPGRSTGIVLVVDDDPAVRHMLGRMLVEDGFTVVEAADGLEALDQVARQPVAVVVTDVRMPRMDGHELARRVAANWPRIRVLLVSAYPGESTELPNRWLTKPFRPEEFVAIVRSLADSYWRPGQFGEA